MDRSYPTNPNFSDSFTTFFTSWLSHRQILFHELLNSNDEIQPHKTLIERFLSHYVQSLLRREVHRRKRGHLPRTLYSMDHPFRATFLWISDFRPTFLLRLIFASISDLTAEQKEDLERLRVETSAVLQESVASPRILGVLMRRDTRLVNGQLSEFEAATAELKEKMVMVVESSDGLRIATVRKVKAILGAVQMVEFLVAAVQFESSIRNRGLPGVDF